jgi:Tol biopolymer transport system component/tRNA A-37 threonylcarbamoyl transferase component Bud32
MIDKAARASVPASLTAALSDRYRIERELGRGGMATVYLAEDIRHARKVAVKVLHPDLAAALGVERFLAEIKTTANLQHPHILSLHDSGEADGFLFYVMPFVDGESLGDPQSREKQLPLEDALRIAREVADALGYAHSHGVIHRDIKPENILLQGGHALVADFGIALAVQSAGGQRMTQTGLSLGTPQYMSPEQAMGERAIDARSDIYALGAVTYEMLAGDPPFTGSTVQAIVAKVLTEKPPSLTAVRDTVTPAMEHAVLRALSKLPADRWPTANAFADALVAPSIAMLPDARAASSRRRSTRTLIVAQGLVTLFAIGAAIWFARRPREEVNPRGPIRFVIDAGNAEHFNVLGSQPVAISPDGRMIAYVGSGVDRRIFVRSLGDVMPRQLAGTSNATTPFFSPDGRWVAYFVSGTVLAPGKLVKVPVDGGPIVEITDGVQGMGGAWLPDGRIVLATQEHTGGLSIVSASGGSPTRIVDEKISGDLGIHRWPRLLPDGETVLFTSWNARVSNARIGVTSVRTHRTKILDIVGANPLTVVDGFLLYMQPSGTIMGVAFDAQSWTTHGEPIPVLEGASLDGQGAVRVAISARGDLVYAAGANELQLVLVDGQGKATPLLSKAGVYSNPRFSPDGRRIALDIATPTPDIWVFDRAGGTLDRITSTGAADRPEWMPDGKRIFFRVSKLGQAALYSTSADGGGTVDSMQAFRDGVHEGTVTPDGRSLVFRTATSGGRDIWSVHLGTGEAPKAVLATPFQELQPRLSPDGRWLAYTSDESGTLEVYVRAFPGESGRVRVSTDGGTEPIWARDGQRLFYRSGDRMMVAHVTSSPQFAVTKREAVFDGAYIISTPHANYDVAPDGKSFVMIAPASGGTQMVMVLDWFAEVRARIAERGKAR